jgi:hypothetical protein
MDVAWGVVFAQCLFFSAALFCCCACLHYLLTVCEHSLHLPTSPLLLLPSTAATPAIITPAITTATDNTAGGVLGREEEERPFRRLHDGDEEADVWKCAACGAKCGSPPLCPLCRVRIDKNNNNSDEEEALLRGLLHLPPACTTTVGNGGGF